MVRDIQAEVKDGLGGFWELRRSDDLVMEGGDGGGLGNQAIQSN
jgi:hypothetical protein